MDEVLSSYHRGTDKAALMVMAWMSDGRRDVRMSSDGLATLMGRQRQAADAAIESLLECEAIRVKEAGSGRRATLYHINTLFTPRDMAFDPAPLETVHPHGDVTSTAPLAGASVAEMQQRLA